MNKKEQESLIDALSYCGLRELPKVDNNEDVWIRALAKVAKADGSFGYVLLEKDGNLNDKVKRDFGSTSIIRKIEEVYPFSYLKPSYMPKFKTQGKDERIKYLQRYDANWDLSKMTVKELDKQVMILAVKKQLSNEKERKY